MRISKQITAAIIIFFLASLSVAAERGRAVHPRSGIFVGQEYRIPAAPDSPWLESVAVAIGPSSGVVLWTEQSSIRYARIAADGHPIDTAGKLLLNTGHPQQHVAIDAFKDQFIAAWGEVSAGKQQIVLALLDTDGHSIFRAPAVIADNIGTSQPIVGVTCMDAGCLVSWGGNGNDGSVSISAVNAQFVSATSSAGNAALLLSPKGVGNAIGTDNLKFATTYAEAGVYGQSGSLVAKFISPNGTTSEVDVMPSGDIEIGSTWMAWDGSEWFVLMVDLTTTGGLAREFRFMRLDAAGRVLGNAATVLESGSVPPLCPWSPDVFLYDPQNRRAVWDGRNFLAFTQHTLTRVGSDGRTAGSVATDDFFPRGYALSVSSAKNGRTLAAYSRDTAVAIRAIDDVP